jgi:broad specificity phosphatase PhoE
LIAARLALLRHGHTAWNRAGRIQGRIDEPLDEQACEHLSHLRLPEEFEGATLFSSPLVRAVETARIVARREPTVAPELIEMDWGRWEGRRGIDLLEDANSGYRHIEEWGWDYQPPGGETPRSVWQRVEPWLGSVKGPAVVVSHIGIMRVLLARATGWNFEGHPPFKKVKRDRLYCVDIHDDGTLSYGNEPVRLIEAGNS